MKLPLSPLFVVLTVFALAVGDAPAQEGKVSLRFLTFPRAAERVPMKLLIEDGEVLDIEVPSNEFSRAYKVKPMAKWTFVEPATAPEQGEPAFSVVGTAPAIASPSQLVIIVRSREAGKGFDVIPIDDRIASFGGGKYLFVNAASVAIGGVVGAQRFSLQPRQHTMVTPEPEAPGSRVCHAALYYPRGGKPKSFFSSKWPVGGNARSLIFIYQDPGTLRLRLHTLRDFP